MSKHRIRHNKTCQNCGAFVDKNYCPKCGQENSESRQSFHHLFTHFFFDFIHYDSAFWRTTKHLFLSPGKLSIEYMNGKRKSYVNPFSFYIFISFIAFFIPTLLPDWSPKEQRDEVTKELEAHIAYRDSLIAATKKSEITIHEADSIYRGLYQDLFDNNASIDADGFVYKTAISVIRNIQNKDRSDRALEFFLNNLPKALFFYMPIFAFWLWLFYNKKKRNYFESGIFTLHFFSVLLLSITICNILHSSFEWLNINWLKKLTWISMILYITFYFFRGCRVFYGSRRLASNFKSLILISINNIMILFILILYGIYVLVSVYK